MRFSKYKAVKTIVDGIKFDSKKEAKRFQDLKLLERACVIENLELQPRFDFILRELGVDTLIFTGIWLDACVQHTIMGAFFRCYKTILLEDCTSTPYEEDRKRALNYIRKYYGTEITTSDRIISQL